MRDWLKKQLAKKEARKQELTTRANAATTLEELRGINTELDTLNTEIADFRSQLDALPEEIAGGATAPVEGRAQIPVAVGAGEGRSNALSQILASYGLRQQEQREEEVNPFMTFEYRKAFMVYARTGVVQEPLKLEKRADAATTSTDAAAMIPTTILNEVIKKMKVYGQVYARVRKLNIPGGVQVPISSLIPVATWISETTTADRQKLNTSSKVTFAYYGLECRISQTLLTNVTTLDAFEELVTELIYEAMIKALDEAVIKGTGNGQPLGVTVDPRVPTEQIVTLDESEISAYKPWKAKVFAKMPLAYKPGAVFFMASGTFETHIDGMVDDAGQPIGRTNYGITDGIQERFGGKEVILVEDDIIKPYDTANEGDVVAVFCNLKNYAINSNLQLAMIRYTDHDKNEIVDKAILIADGKLLDPNGVVIVKKGAAVSGT
ncbi:MAG: phage major capsid protein [Paenibacillus sp.]|uniref:phage major capsid protein n=1 Tax=Paenibacillus sp. TaxID=58172 RepID=UPI002908C491|nr:phage major capsid protein [Paenibacillus sp.]MDU4696399.1 phage major capsid protein [Paenibacillus sp.]